MKAIELLSETEITAPHDLAPELNDEPEQLLNHGGVHQDRLARSENGPMSRLALPRSKLAVAPKRIFIVEDRPAVRERLTQMLNEAGDLMVCGSAGAVEQALPAILHHKPDLVLANISFPGKRGLELIKQLRSVDRAVKLLVISTNNQPLHAARVLRFGGDGYIMKHEVPEAMVCAVQDVLEGRIYISEEVMERPRVVGRSRSSRQVKPSAISTNGFRA